MIFGQVHYHHGGRRLGCRQEVQGHLATLQTSLTVSNFIFVK